MSRPASYQRDDAIAALRAHAAKHGVKEGARLAREQFPNVPIGTWGRWRQMALGNVTDSQVLDDLTQEIKKVVPSPEALAQAIADPVSVTKKALDFWRMLDELQGDARLMREFALARGSNGSVKLRVPFALRDAHKMRCDLIRIALQQSEVAYGVQRAQEFFDAVIDAVAQESPDCQRRIMQRLSVVHGEAVARGF